MTPLIAVAIWSAFDPRAIFVGVAVIFIIYPMAMTIVWFNYAMSPYSIRAISKKTVSVSEKGLTIEYIPLSDGHQPLPGETICWDAVLAAELTGDSLHLVLGHKMDQKMVLPAEAFSDQAWSFIIKHIADKLPSYDI